jgi:hypothetical protein
VILPPLVFPDWTLPRFISGGSDGVLEREPASFGLSVAVFAVETRVIDEILKTKMRRISETDL